MPDLRDEVAADRDGIKKIEMIIPGFRGYRTREDLRVADSMLRNEVDIRMKRVETDAVEIRRVLTEGMEIERLNDIKGLISDIQTFRQRIAHAEQGYSGFAADFNINEDNLNRLYDYDLGLFEAVDILKDRVGKIDPAGSEKDYKQRVHQARQTLRHMMERFDLRIETISGTLVRK